MALRNQEYANMRYYKGLIRDLQAQLNDALARIKLLEDKKPPTTSTPAPANIELFMNNDLNRQKTLPATGGLTEEEIKALVIQWIENGDLPISIHDHTTSSMGGDAYANKGAALQ